MPESAPRWVHVALWLCVGTVAFIAISAFAGVRFTTVDDMNWGLQAWSGQWWQAVVHDATVQGRVIRPSFVAMFVPYWTDNRAYYEAMRFGALLASVATAAWVLRLVVRDTAVPLLFGLFFFAFTSNSWYHHIDSSFPFVWHALWTTYLLSLGLLIVAVRRNSIALAWLGAAVYILGLHEPFIPCILIHVFFAMRSGPTWRTNIRFCFPYLILLALWLGLWVVWRMLHPSQYPGSQFAPVFSPMAIVRTIVQFSLGGIPLADVLSGQAPLLARDLSPTQTVLWIVKAFAVLLGVCILAAAGRSVSGRTKQSFQWDVALALVALGVLANSLIGLSPQYQTLAANGVHRYIYTEFAYFGWCALLALCIAFLLRRPLHSVAVAPLALAFAAGSFAADWGSARTNREQHLSTQKWNTVDRLLASEAFAAVPDGSTVFVDGLNKPRGIAATDDHYWENYFVLRGRKRVRIVDSPDALLAARGSRYALLFVEEAEGTDQYVLFAPLERAAGEEGVLPVRRAVLVPNGNRSSIVLGGTTGQPADACGSSVLVNGKTKWHPFQGAFGGHVALVPDSHGVPVATIDLPQTVDVRTLWASFAMARDQPEPLEIELASGFYAWESADGLERSVWSSGPARMHLINRGEAPVTVVFAADFLSLDAQSVTVSSSGRTLDSFQVQAAFVPQNRNIEIELSPGTTDIAFDGTATPHPPGNGDPRLLALRIVNPSLSCAAQDGR